MSIVKFGDQKQNITRAVQMCGGLGFMQKITPSDKVLLKPNLVMRDEQFALPKYGVLTTSVVVEAVIKLLAEAGCKNVVIGEGSADVPQGGTRTALPFDGLGYDKMQKRYGLKLVDFNRGPFEKVDFGSFSLDIAREALEADFIINLPVLKTHNLTKVSLGFKNLKGCLKKSSKMYCHHPHIPLDTFVSFLGEKLYPDLTIIDGIYSLEKGPIVTGKAYRKDLLVASTDMFAADVVGSRLMGFSPEEIGHLNDFASRNNRNIKGTDLEIAGEPLEVPDKPYQWDWKWKEDDSGPTAFARRGITGVFYPKYDATICSGCSFFNNLLLVLLIDAYHGEPFPNIEFLSGKQRLSQGGYNKTFLFGNCIIKANYNNPHIKEAVKITGCPPSIDTIVKALNENGISADIEAYRKYRQSLMDRYLGKKEFSEELFMVT